MRKIPFSVAFVMIPLTLAAACDRGAEEEASAGMDPVMDFDTGTVRIETSSDTFELSVDIAENDQQRGYGLMERAHLPEDAGMIFLYPQVQGPNNSFYMWRVLIPLDIAFIDEDGQIVAIRGMDPCASTNPSVCYQYTAGVAWASALEVNRGYFEQRGIDIGDRVVLERPGEDLTAESDG